MAHHDMLSNSDSEIYYMCPFDLNSKGDYFKWPFRVLERHDVNETVCDVFLCERRSLKALIEGVDQRDAHFHMKFTPKLQLPMMSMTFVVGLHNIGKKLGICDILFFCNMQSIELNTRMIGVILLGIIVENS